VSNYSFCCCSLQEQQLSRVLAWCSEEHRWSQTDKQHSANSDCKREGQRKKKKQKRSHQITSATITTANLCGAVSDKDKYQSTFHPTHLATRVQGEEGGGRRDFNNKERTGNCRVTVQRSENRKKVRRRVTVGLQHVPVPLTGTVSLLPPNPHLSASPPHPLLFLLCHRHFHVSRGRCATHRRGFHFLSARAQRRCAAGQAHAPRTGTPRSRRFLYPSLC
jgi:hypothetical protein